MGIERRIRRLGTVGITYPWMRRYVTFGLVNGSVRHTLAVKLTSRASQQTVARATERRRRNVTGQGKQ